MNENTIYICEHCGCIISADEAQEVSTPYGYRYHVCKDCLSRYYETCPDCGRYVRHDRMARIVLHDGTEKRLCRTCASADYVQCCDCGMYYDPEDIWASDSSDVSICNSCADEWTSCEDCDHLIRRSDARIIRGHTYCEYCACYHHSGTIHNYSYKPDPEFQYRSSDNEETALTFGVEKEVDYGEDRGCLADDLCDLHLPMYLKHDGSLEDEGVEIVTHPCSLAYHMYEFRWAEVDRICKSHGYEDGAESTGLHIHIGRKQMGADSYDRNVTAGNIVLLVNSLWDELVAFSRRDCDKLDDWAQRPYVDVDRYASDEELTDAALATREDGRYQAVNLCNRNTVEIRIFKGTLKRETTIAAIQLVSNLTKYAMTHTPTECTTAVWSDVVRFEQFKELDNYCRKMGL